jgi:hypothetical protein
VAIEIGGIPIALRTTDPAFLKLLQDRYADYAKTGPQSEFGFDCRPSFNKRLRPRRRCKGVHAEWRLEAEASYIRKLQLNQPKPCGA